jgi:6-pyruvoyltetrahydropterin/6-carboxytetrahydropterin synthase
MMLDENPTAENIARAIYEHVRAAGYPVRSVQLWETPTSHATYSER